MKKVLVTGASGFFGLAAITELKERGFEVHALSRRALPLDGVCWHEVDLLSSNRMVELLDATRPSHLLHLAWNVGPGFWTASDNLDWGALTLRLIRAFHEAGGQRIVSAGTCAEYDWQDTSPLFISEDHPRGPATLYGHVKDCTRRVQEAFALQAGISQAWGVLFMSYGQRERPERLVPAVIADLLAGRATRTTSGEQVRDWLDCRDVGRGFAELLDSQVEGPVNLASGLPVAVRDIILKLGEICGRPDLVRFGDIASRKGDPSRLVANVDRLSGEVGFRPARTLDQGLSDAVDWWKSKAIV
ncbi:NAD(P)-dependent oxidoreductase [Bradyrhizobium prioriisuperbiae]|uniref:NAD-dependent epimerase/dehydratase family protein n=1 Tax=Bradyrhizobium prioriisuperbiae TaxID=2854389 RepID=UPI0028ECE172|nr:NAD(P)-dependent oxidoreductase [Bradyrhizobium prioritasuperba]